MSDRPRLSLERFGPAEDALHVDGRVPAASAGISRVAVATPGTDGSGIAEILCRELGRDVDVGVADTAEALRLCLQHGDVDVVVCDSRRTPADGLDALRLVRSVDADLPIVAILGEHAHGLVADTLRAGATDCISAHALLRLPAAVVRAARETAARRRHRGTEHALRQGDALLAQLAENLKEALWIRDLATRRLVYMSPGFESIWGRPALGLEDHAALLETVHPDDRARVAALPAVEGLDEQDLEYRILRPDGSVRFVWTRTFPVRDGNGVAFRVVGLSEDVTLRRRLEDELRQSQRNEALSRLAAGVAHDFNNVLTVIVGAAETLEYGGLDRQATSGLVREILDATSRGANITRQLMLFSTQEETRPRVFDVNEVLRDLQKTLARLVGEAIDLRVQLARRPLEVECDPAQLEQAVVNLVVNAQEAMPGGGALLIETSAIDAGGPEPGAATRPMARIVVTDTGCGMAPETLARAFEPLFTTKGRAGLGLATVDAVVRRFGGRVSATSEVGRGTSVEMLCPMAAAPSRSRPSAAARGTESVLVIEDDESVRDIVGSFLRQLGYDVSVASDPTEALALVADASRRIDVVLTDVVMPKLSGPDFARQLHVLRPTVAVIFMSGYTADHALRRRATEEGAVLVQKPFALAELAGVIRSTLDGRG